MAGEVAGEGQLLLDNLPDSLATLLLVLVHHFLPAATHDHATILGQIAHGVVVYRVELVYVKLHQGMLYGRLLLLDVHFACLCLVELEAAVRDAGVEVL